MKLNKVLNGFIAAETVFIIFIAVLFYLLSPSEISHFYLYEVFSALISVIIATFGLLKMQDLT